MDSFTFGVRLCLAQTEGDVLLKEDSDMNELDTTEVRKSFHTAIPESLIRRVRAVAALEDRDVADVTAVALSLYIANRLPKDNDSGLKNE